MAKTAVAKKKAHKDKVLAQRATAGCALFKYRSNKAFSYERDLNQRGVTIRDGNFNTQSMINSTLLSQPISMAQTAMQNASQISAFQGNATMLS